MSGKLLFLCSFLILMPEFIQYKITGYSDVKKVKSNNDDGKGSLVFVFDTTASMFNDLRQLREGAELILKTALEESDVIGNFVFVPFHDPGVGPATVTKNKHVFKAALNIVNVYGGGDCPEMSLAGLQLALNVSRPRSFVYVFTDATASDHHLVGKVLDAIQRKQSQVVFVLTGHCRDLDRPSYAVYGEIAAASSGQVFNLNKTSVHEVLEYVRSSIRGRSVNLAAGVNPPGYNYTNEVPVDKSVKEVLVSVSGSRPQITVLNPRGARVAGPPQLVTTLDLSEIMIVKLLEPDAGRWNITVGSEREHSVRVTATSDLTFEHGFSVRQPASLAHTSYRPLQGTYNYMLLSLSGAARPLTVSCAEVMDLSGRTVFEVPLKPVGAALYRAEPFIPPEYLFYIAIKGRNELGEQFRRVGRTAVQVDTPDIPYLVAPKKVEGGLHERVVVSCRAESLVPLSLAWTRDSGTIQQRTNALQSTSLKLVIEDLREADVGQYHCVGENAAGVTRVSTVVKLTVEPPHVTVSPTSAAPTEGDHVTVTCSVHTDTSLLNAQLEFHGKNKNFVNKFRIAPSTNGSHTFDTTVDHVTGSDSGTYACVAANAGGQTKQSVQIAVRNKPTAHILGPHAFSRGVHSDVQLTCHAEHAARVLWLGPGNDTRQSHDVDGTFTSMLNVRNITEDGVWTCIALRDSYKASDFVELSVLMKPQVSVEGPRIRRVMNGSTSEVVCIVRAKPMPRIIWHKETEKFLDNIVTSLGASVYRSVLTLNSSAEDVEATYFCVGENSEGIHQDNVTVHVTRNMTLLQGFTDMSVELFSKVRLPCVMDSYPPANLTWYHNGTALPVDCLTAEDESTIVIDSVDFQHLGNYTCVARNGYENLTVSGIVAVHGLEAPVVEPGPPRVEVRRGAAVNITCRVIRGKPKPTVTWLYTNSINFTMYGEPNRYWVGFDRARVEEAGRYRCVAENAVGRDQRDVQLEVLYAPEEVPVESRVVGPLLVPVGSRAVLGCKVRASPAPTVVWAKDGRPVPYSQHLYLTADSELVIEEARVHDAGLYTCRAANRLGALLKTFTVDVYMSPIISVSGVDSVVEVTEGELVELPCSARGVPTPRVTWLHDGRQVAAARKHVDDYGLRFVANLTDFGEFVCVASNGHGNASLNYTVLVWVAPHIKGEHEELVTIQVGSRVNLSCDAVGFPVPEVVWQVKADTEEDMLLHDLPDVEYNDVGLLSLKNASFEHEGVYACVARNIAGVAKKFFDVNVVEGPKFVIDNFTEPYILTEADIDFSVMCQATGKPRPYVYWIKDGYYLNTDSRYDVDFYGTMTIKKPTEDLSGTYTCLAKNAAGNITKDITVKIYRDGG